MKPTTVFENLNYKSFKKPLSKFDVLCRSFYFYTVVRDSPRKVQT